jgi:AbrB family looped-hinge helix DNA binding protein
MNCGVRHTVNRYGMRIFYMAATDNEVQVGAQGRLVIPAALRKALYLKPGDRLVARQEGDRLVLERHEAVVNWAEVIQKSLWRHVDISGLLTGFIEVGVVFAAFIAEQGEIAVGGGTYFTANRITPA